MDLIRCQLKSFQLSMYTNWFKMAVCARSSVLKNMDILKVLQGLQHRIVQVLPLKRELHLQYWSNRVFTEHYYPKEEFESKPCLQINWTCFKGLIRLTFIVNKPLFCFCCYIYIYVGLVLIHSCPTFLPWWKPNHKHVYFEGRPRECNRPFK